MEVNFLEFEYHLTNYVGDSPNDGNLRLTFNVHEIQNTWNEIVIYLLWIQFLKNFCYCFDGIDLDMLIFIV